MKPILESQILQHQYHKNKLYGHQQETTGSVYSFTVTLKALRSPEHSLKLANSQ